MLTQLQGRQKVAELFYPNGAVYVSTTSFIKKQRNFIFGGKCGGYIMDELRFIDIDTEFDLKLSEILYRIFKKKYSDKI